MPKPRAIRLLIVDDHEVVRIGLTAVLNLTPGMTVVGQASKKAEATALAARLEPDVVLLDIRLPDGSGVDAARAILAARPHTKVLFLTSFADDQTVLEAILSGAQGYVLKDIASDALVHAIRTVGSGHALIDPRLTQQTLHWLTHDPASPNQPTRPSLSPQEQRLLPLVARGLTNKEIAAHLGLSEKTVKNYLANIYSKLQIGRRSQVAAFYAGGLKPAHDMSALQ